MDIAVIYMGMMVALALVEYRKSGLLTRVTVTPVSTSAYVGSMIIATVVIAVFQGLIVLLVARRTGNLVYTAGQVGNAAREGFGKLGTDVTIEEGYRRAQQAALDNLACIKSMIGDLDKITQFVKLLCMVNSAPGFIDQPAVADGASDLIVDVFGERGRHARSSVGVVELSTNACIEIEMIVEVEDL